MSSPSESFARVMYSVPVATRGENHADDADTTEDDNDGDRDGGDDDDDDDEDGGPGVGIPPPSPPLVREFRPGDV